MVGGDLSCAAVLLVLTVLAQRVHPANSRLMHLGAYQRAAHTPSTPRIQNADAQLWDLWRDVAVARIV